MGFWTEELAEKCRELWQAGKSAQTIFIEIGAPSRCAVISKVRRHGWLSPNSTGPMSQRKKKAKKKEDKASIPSAPQAPLAPLDTPASVTSFSPGGKKLFLELKNDDCRWPIGEPEDLGFAFCGAPRSGAAPYCAAHCSVAYEAPQTTAQKFVPWLKGKRTR